MKTLQPIKLIALFLTVCAILGITGCGGGFGSDSPNANQFQQSIFGTDTLE